MEKIIRIGMDISKQVFQLHGVDESEQPVLRRTLRRGALERFFAAMPPTVVGMEACGGAHHWARVLRGLGHEVRLLPPQYVKPYVKRGKNDAADAAAICEAMSRPSMRFVPVKTAEDQASLVLLGTRELLNKQRTMLINSLRGHAAEFGIVAAKGDSGVDSLLERIAVSPAVPELARDGLAELAHQIEALDARIAGLEVRLRAWHRANACSRRLATIPGISLITACALAMKVAAPSVFPPPRHL